MDDEDTEVGPAPRPDTDVEVSAVVLADTAEFDDTAPEVDAQGTIDTTAAMFEDTGLVIIDKPSVIVEKPPANSDRLVITFRKPEPSVRFKPRATTAGDWPPTPRAPAPVSIRDRAFKRARVYTAITVRAETKT